MPASLTIPTTRWNHAAARRARGFPEASSSLPPHASELRRPSVLDYQRKEDKGRAVGSVQQAAFAAQQEIILILAAGMIDGVRDYACARHEVVGPPMPLAVAGRHQLDPRL